MGIIDPRHTRFAGGVPLLLVTSGGKAGQRTIAYIFKCVCEETQMHHTLVVKWKDTASLEFKSALLVRLNN